MQRRRGSRRGRRYKIALIQQHQTNAFQIAVTEVPFLTAAFGTVALSFTEWVDLLLLALLPLVFHEVRVLFKWIFGRFAAR